MSELERGGKMVTMAKNTRQRHHWAGKGRAE